MVIRSVSRKTGQRLTAALSALRTACLAAILVSLTACLNTATLNCAAGEHREINEMLYFGRDIMSKGEVSAEQWQQFVDEVVTPRFPRGLSVWPVYGQWKMADGIIIQENSFALNVLHRNDAASNTAIVEIMETYKSRFQQEAVLRVKGSACVSF
jgi:hypothetical protein